MTARLNRTLAAVCFLLTSCTPASDQISEAKTRQLAKIAPELAVLYEEYSSYLASRRAGSFHPTNSLLQIVDDRVVIDAVAAGEINLLKADLISLGMQQAVAFGRIVSGQLPISTIPALETLPSLNFARAASALPQGGQPR